MDRPMFKHLGEWGVAVARASHGRLDERLLRAPTGAGEVDPATGGFLVPEELAPEVLGTVYEDRNSILAYVQKFNFPERANTFSLPGADETSRANGLRWGGVITAVEPEGVQPTSSNPRFKMTRFSATKLIALIPATDELLADADNFDQFLRRALADELRYVAEQYILSSAGTGAGLPLGVANSPALITVAKVSAQTAGTIQWANIAAMWSALPAASRKRAIWALSESAMAQADANMPYPVYPPAGCPNPDDVPRIQGRPALETDVLPICGTPGDILLIDPLWYGFCSKPMSSALSGHVLFTEGQTIFRIVWRIDGKPLISSQITASDGTNRSPYVALAQRS